MSSASPCNLFVAVLRKSLTVTFCAAVLFSMVGNAYALSRSAKSGTAIKKKVVTTETVTGPTIKCHQWGFMVVQLKVVKTEVTGAGKPKVSIKITSVSWPTYPDHTPKSKYINAQALPLLQTETLQLQADAGTKLENISGATNTTVSWRSSLQAALAKAQTP
jgi:uncharacterized protein with FMN-binding domain